MKAHATDVTTTGLQITKGLFISSWLSDHVIPKMVFICAGECNVCCISVAFAAKALYAIEYALCSSAASFAVAWSLTSGACTTQSL